MAYCLTRITNPKQAQYFADGKHKFYLEYCCHRPCVKNTDKCKSCHKIHSGARSQFDSTYPHGHIDEPIPDHSHIFGGTWYCERVSLWGAPSKQALALALQHQTEAHQYRSLPSKADKPCIEMKKIAKTTNSDATNDVVKQKRKPKIAAPTIVEAPTLVEAPTIVEAIITPISVKPKRKPATKTKKEKSPTHNILTVLDGPSICKEVVIPTHIEQQIEMVDTDGYEIEYVPLTLIEIAQTVYFRDAKKNKLYQKIKEKIIGLYVGRYCPHTGTICTEVPDSDEENDS